MTKCNSKVNVNTTTHFPLMCQVRTSISTECITAQYTVEIRPKQNMISLVITVIEREDIDETVQGSSHVSELEDRNMLSVVCRLIEREYPLTQMHRLAHSHVQAVLWSIHPLQLLKVFPSITDIDESGCRC